MGRYSDKDDVCGMFVVAVIAKMVSVAVMVAFLAFTGLNGDGDGSGGDGIGVAGSGRNGDSGGEAVARLRGEGSGTMHEDSVIQLPSRWYQLARCINKHGRYKCNAAPTQMSVFMNDKVMLENSC